MTNSVILISCVLMFRSWFYSVVCSSYTFFVGEGRENIFKKICVHDFFSYFLFKPSVLDLLTTTFVLTKHSCSMFIIQTILFFPNFIYKYL